MKIILNKSKLVKFINSQKNLGFVPTMGALHKGHISLIKRSMTLCDKTVVSIYINKSQFNKKSDFINYPRNINKDIKLLQKLKVDFLYIPSNKQIYPSGINKNIKINSFSKKLCGEFRIGHFEAVVDVIDRFIKIIRPKKIFFGEKDMQQLKIVEDFIKKNHNYTKIVGCKTIREKNGIALSSRNFHLSVKEKNIASNVYKILFKNKNRLLEKKISLNNIKKIILEIGVSKIDYLKILNINKIIKPFKKKMKKKIFIAYYLRSTRLIDNI